MPLPPRAAARTAPRSLAPKRWNPTAGAGRCRLIGGKLDKVFASPATLTVQKLGTLYTAHPAITLPDWASYTTLTIQDAYGSIVFVGSVSDYQSFLFPANGEYKAELSVWRVPEGGMATQFEGGKHRLSAQKIWGWKSPQSPPAGIVMPSGSPYRPARRWSFPPSGLEQGGIVGLRISGMTGDAAPTVETDLAMCSACVQPMAGGPISRRHTTLPPAGMR